MAQHIVSANTSLDRVYKHSGLSASVNYFVAPTPVNPTGITFDDKVNLLAVHNNGTGEVYQYKAISNTTLSSFSSPAAAPDAIAWDGTDLLTADSGTGLIYRHSGFSSTVLATFAVTGGSTVGLAWDGTDVLAASAGFIWRYAGFSGTVSASFAAPASNTSDIHWDGTDLWSIDSTTNVIYHHSGFSSTVLATFAAPGTTSSGIAILDEPFRVWVPNPGTLELNKFALDGTDLFSGAGLSTIKQAQATIVDDRGNFYFTNRNAGGASQSWGRVEVGKGSIEFFGISGGPNEIRGIDYDQDGNIWIAVDGLDSVQKWTPDGSMLLSLAVGTRPIPVAVDGNKWVWVGDFTSGLVSRFSLSGTRLVTYDIGIHITAFALQKDNSAIWATHGSTTSVVSKNTQHGEKLFTVIFPSVPAAITADDNGDVWVADHFNQRIVKLDGDTGVPLITVDVGIQPLGLAIDDSNNVWSLNLNSNNITKVSSAGTILGTFDSGGGNPRTLGDFIGYLRTQLVDANTESFYGNISIVDTTTDLFDGNVNIIETATGLFDGIVIISDIDQKDFDGQIVVFNVAQDEFDGNLNVTIAGTIIVAGRLTVSDAAFASFDGVIMVADTTVVLFDGSLLLVEFIGDTNFDGAIDITDAAFALFDGQLIVFSQVLIKVDGRLNVLTPVRVFFDGSVQVFGAPDRYDGFFVVTETQVERGFSGELFITRGELGAGGMSTNACLSHVEFVVELPDILIAPRPTPPDVGQAPITRAPVFSLPNPLPPINGLSEI